MMMIVLVGCLVCRVVVEWCSRFCLVVLMMSVMGLGKCVYLLGGVKCRFVDIVVIRVCWEIVVDVCRYLLRSGLGMNSCCVCVCVKCLLCVRLLVVDSSVRVRWVFCIWMVWVLMVVICVIRLGCFVVSSMVSCVLREKLMIVVGFCFCLRMWMSFCIVFVCDM